MKKAKIASAFNLSRKTVANYHYAIKSKLGVDSDIELLYFGLRHGLVEPISRIIDSRKWVATGESKPINLAKPMANFRFLAQYQGSVCGSVM